MKATVHNIHIVLFAVFFAALGSPGADAHAHLEHAVPGMGSTVQAPPDRIELSFSENLEAAFSTIEVLDGKGMHFEQGKAEIDSANAKVLRVGLKPMTAGTYTVVWRVVSVDTHRSNGTFDFTISP